MNDRRKRYSIDKKHAAFVQATREAYRCGSEADAINLLLDFIQDGTLETALARIRQYQHSLAIAQTPLESNLLPASPLPQTVQYEPLPPQTFNSSYPNREAASELEILAAVLPEEF